MSAERMVGRVLEERFRIDSVQEGGRASTLFQGYDLRTERKVAIKAWTMSAFASPAASDHLIYEAQRAKERLHEPHVLETLAVGESDGWVWTAHEWVEGRSLEQFATRRPEPLRADNAVPMVQGILLGLAHGHEAGLVHGALDPRSVLLNKKLNPVIREFGVAEPAPATEEASPRDRMYLAPEQILEDAKAFGPATDLYACGAILHLLLTREPPFQGATAGEVDTAHLERRPPTLGGRAVNPPPFLERVLFKALEKHPNNRFQSAMEMHAALEKVMQGENPQVELSRFYTGGKPAEEEGLDPVGWLVEHPVLTGFGFMGILVAGILGIFTASGPEQAPSPAPPPTVAPPSPPPAATRPPSPATATATRAPTRRGENAGFGAEDFEGIPDELARDRKRFLREVWAADFVALREVLARHQDVYEGLSFGGQQLVLTAVQDRSRMQLEGGETEGVKACLDWTLETEGPHHVRTWALLARQREMSGDSKGAVWAMKRTLELAGLEEKLVLEEAMEEFAERLHKLARQEVRHRDTAADLERGRRALAGGHIERALESFREVVQAIPDGRAVISRALADRGLEALREKQRERIYPLFKAALDFNSMNVLAHQGLGDYYLLFESDLRRARFHLERAMEHAEITP